MTQFDDGLRVGKAHYGPAVGSNTGGTREDKGAPLSHIYVEEFGQVAQLDADGICVAATATEAATLSATGALTSGGTADLDVPRAVSITSTADNSGVSFTVTGTDKYGVVMTESITGPNNGTTDGNKAFSSVTSVASDGAVTGNVDVGTNDTIGLSYRLANEGKFLGLLIDGAAVTAGVTVTAGLTTTQTSTATTGDVRGTLTSTGTAPDGSAYFTAMYVPATDTKDELYGVDQA